MLRLFKNSIIQVMHYKSPLMEKVRYNNSIIQTEKNENGYSFVEYFEGDFNDLIPMVDKVIIKSNKELPMKPIKSGSDLYDCPICKNNVHEDYITHDLYCHNCGQKLDWSDEDGK